MTVNYNAQLVNIRVLVFFHCRQSALTGKFCSQSQTLLVCREFTVFFIYYIYYYVPFSIFSCCFFYSLYCI